MKEMRTPDVLSWDMTGVVTLLEEWDMTGVVTLLEEWVEMALFSVVCVGAWLFSVEYESVWVFSVVGVGV